MLVSGSTKGEEGEETDKYKHTMQSLCMTCLNDMPGQYNASLNVLDELGNYLELFSRGDALFILRQQAKSSMFTLLEDSNMNANGIFEFF